MTCLVKKKKKKKKSRRLFKGIVVSTHCTQAKDYNSVMCGSVSPVAGVRVAACPLRRGRLTYDAAVPALQRGGGAGDGAVGAILVARVPRGGGGKGGAGAACGRGGGATGQGGAGADPLRHGQALKPKRSYDRGNSRSWATTPQHQ